MLSDVHSVAVLPYPLATNTVEILTCPLADKLNQPKLYRITPNLCVYIYNFLPIPYVIFALLFSLSLLVVTQIRGHLAGSSPPLPTPTTVRALYLYREKTSALFSLLDWRRTVLTQARRAQQHSYPFHFCKYTLNLSTARL